MEQNTNTREVKIPRSRLILGSIVFISGILMPLLVPLVTSSNLSAAWKTTLSGALLIGIPELFMLITVAILGKEGYHFLKQKIFAFLKKHGPADHVSKVRYRIGLVMFTLPLIIALLFPYAANHFEGFRGFEMYINIGGDVLLFSSFFVLGGEFWDKLRSLFIYKKSTKSGI